ncbi:sialate O-acetylesterase [Niabella ginsengisoli]|uniref:Sialate O-acetylesterase n=1 Tax=Niabella ginsengisoli TaxID=522298 RepID=A0ABS9SR16_9BACT|nr:sialate O-acetylesterase [Niabella ginsengisoli]MCH5600812.1 sialate O-acetylesterase [Niabella ginsengisoli]
MRIAVPIFLKIGMIAGIFLAGCSTNKSAQQIPKNKEKFHVFILMGQSNMAGYGTLEAADTIPVPHVFKLPTVYKESLQWQPAAHPLHNRLSSDRFGLGLPFAKQYLKHNKGITVGLIPLGWGGASINQLNKGSNVYNDFLVKLAFAKKYGTVKGVLWHQGESDTVDEEAANSYEQKLHKLTADIRKDVGDENLPIIVGNLAEFYGTSKEHNAPDRVKRINKVKQVLRNVANKIPATGFVETTGCTSIDAHNVHFDRASYIILGKRYYEVYAGIKQ